MSINRIAVRGTLALLLGAGFIVSVAHADERREWRERERHETYRSPHWIYDDRYHHGHYYPAVGYAVEVLPPGHLALSFGSRRLFFQAGVWYEPAPRGFAVVRPPVGIVVPMLPPGYSMVSVAGVPYYYANDTYYAAAPGGYAVANPPMGATYIEAPSALPPAPQPQIAPPAPATQSAPQASGGTWYYCESAKAYYPYVATCKEGWKPMPATPPPGR